MTEHDLHANQVGWAAVLAALEADLAEAERRVGLLTGIVARLTADTDPGGDFA